jgi:hypothetical protein
MSLYVALASLFAQEKKPGCLGGLSGLPRSQGALARGTKTAPMLLTPVTCASFKKARRPKPTSSMMFPAKSLHVALGAGLGGIVPMHLSFYTGSFGCWGFRGTKSWCCERDGQS